MFVLSTAPGSDSLGYHVLSHAQQGFSGDRLTYVDFLPPPHPCIIMFRNVSMRMRQIVSAFSDQQPKSSPGFLAMTG